MKKKSNSTTPTAAELAVLQLLWQRGPLSVKEVHEALDSNKPVVYTTVLKTMQVMMEKAMLDRTSAGRKHIYRAVIEQDATQDTLLDSFLDKTFGGSAKSLVMRALGKHTPSAEEIDELKAFLDQLEGDENQPS
ncbi:MAG: BlaI/MecI/CopY family transcriptional regulator [Saprospiraceae bacterium]